MASLNKCCFIANMTKDPELKYTNSGMEVCSFSIAVNEKYKDKEVTEYIDVTAWSKLASIIAEWGHKGMQCYIEGRWTTDKFKDKDGNDRKAVKITAEKFIMLGSKGKGDGGSKGQSQGQSQRDEYPTFGPDEDVPF